MTRFCKDTFELTCYVKYKKIKHVEILCTPQWSKYTPAGFASWQIPNMIHS